MSTTLNGSHTPSPLGLGWNPANLSGLIARLSDRAAYATGDEYAEIRTLMTALKAVLAPQA
jgi:hypothetical protein